VGVVVASAVMPTFIAQQWFVPTHSEDVIEWKDEDECVQKADAETPADHISTKLIEEDIT